MYRMDAFVLGICLQIRRNPRDRATHKSLHFTVACCWLIAAINARPQDWADHLTISNASLPANYDQERDVLTRVRTGGAYFFHRIEMEPTGPVSQVHQSDQLDLAIARCFRHRDITETFRFLYTLERTLNTQPGDGFDRQPNRGGESDALGILPEDLAGSDFFEFRELPEDVREETADLWVSGITQYINKAPNEKLGGTWMTPWFFGTPHHFGHLLEPRVEDEVDVHAYLSKFWRGYMTKKVTHDAWTKAFHLLFPTDPATIYPPTSTGWKTLVKLNAWIRFMGGRPPAERAIISVALKKRFDTLRWIGTVKLWKLWRSGSVLESGYKGHVAGVMLILNPNAQRIPM